MRSNPAIVWSRKNSTRSPCRPIPKDQPTQRSSCRETCQTAVCVSRNDPVPARRPTRDPQGTRRPRFSFFSFTCQRTEEQNPSIANPSPSRRSPGTRPQSTARQPPLAKGHPARNSPRTYGSETRLPQDRIRNPARLGPAPPNPSSPPKSGDNQSRRPHVAAAPPSMNGVIDGPPGGVNSDFQKSVTWRFPAYFKGLRTSGGIHPAASPEFF